MLKHSKKHLGARKMTSIATTLSGVISIIRVGQEIYRMIAEYMDEMDQIK